MRRNPDFVFRAKRTSPFKSARWAGRQFSRLLAAEVCAISSSNAGYTVFRGSVKGTDYPLHSPVSPSISFPCVTVCHHISTAVYVQINLMSLSLFDSWDVAELRTDLVAFFCSNQQYRPVEMWRHTRRKKISSFARNGPIHLNRPGGQGVSAGQPSCAPSAVIMLDTPCSEVVRRVLAIHCIRQFPPSLPLPCVTLCHHISTGV